MTFFPVSTKKFTILSVITFGIYPIYWFYQNWKRIRDAAVVRQGAPYQALRISPFWRTFFAPFWGIPLLTRIKQRAESEHITVTWDPVQHGLAFFAASMTAFLPGLWSLVSIGMFAPLVPPLQTCQQVNAAAGNPEGVNDAFGLGNIVTMIIGGLTWALLLVAIAVR